MIFQGCLSCRNSYLVPGGLYHEVYTSLGMRIRQLSFNTSYLKLHFGGRRRCGKGVKRLRAILYAPRHNASCEVDRFEVAQGMDLTCTQNPWAITAVLLCTAVQQLFLFLRVHAVLLYTAVQQLFLFFRVHT